jgi:hypothetical protein
MRSGTRLASLVATSALLASGLAISATPANPALADGDKRPINRVNAPLVDLDGNPIEAQDAGVPAGDGQNAVDTESVAMDRGARLAIEIAHALGSKDSQDMKGFEGSLYRGKWFMPKKEKIRKCIMDRESNHRYRAVSAGGTYRGAYQMNRGLARGATFMMQREVKKEMPEAVSQVKRLRKIPTQQWNRYWQDRAFWTIWRKGKGKHHWRTNYRPCF